MKLIKSGFSEVIMMRRKFAMHPLHIQPANASMPISGSRIHMLHTWLVVRKTNAESLPQDGAINEKILRH